jgi:hypothetical protein
MYSLPSLGVAANYAASFRPVEKVDGFSDVKSDIAAEYLMKLPQVQFEAEAALAKQALAERGATLRREMEVDYYQDRDARALKQSKASALLGLLGAGSSDLGGGISMGESVDVLANSAARERQHNDMLSSLNARMTGYDAESAAAIKAMGGMPQMPSPGSVEELKLPQAAPYRQPAPDDMGSLKNQLDIMKAFHNAYSKGGRK